MLCEVSNVPIILKKEDVDFTLGIHENNMKIVGEIVKNIKDEVGNFRSSDLCSWPG